MAIKNARIVTGTDRHWREDLFLGGRITAVGSTVSVTAGAQIIDGTGKTVYPGLVDGLTSCRLDRNRQHLRVSGYIRSGRHQSPRQSLGGRSPAQRAHSSRPRQWSDDRAHSADRWIDFRSKCFDPPVGYNARSPLGEDSCGDVTIQPAGPLSPRVRRSHPRLRLLRSANARNARPRKRSWGALGICWRKPKRTVLLWRLRGPAKFLSLRLT